MNRQIVGQCFFVFLKHSLSKFLLLILSLSSVSIITFSAEHEIHGEEETMTERSPSAVHEHVWVITERPLTRQQIQILRNLDSLLIMIPGVSSGDLTESCQFLNQVRIQGGYEVAMFYDWEAGDLSRKVVSPTAVGSAARRLVKLYRTFQKEAGKEKSIDLLAHSAGTVVVNKTAKEIVNSGSSIRFRRILFLGTALGADEKLDALKTISGAVLNVHSAYDKVNRNINDRIGKLSALHGGNYRNHRMDHSLSGRIMRHYVFLSSNPENWLQYGHYLGTGEWLEGKSYIPDNDYRIGDLHKLALWIKAHPNQPNDELKGTLLRLLNHSDPKIRYYGLIIIGLLKTKSLTSDIKTLLEDKQMPVYVRKEVYQALGNFEDGHHVDFLRRARKLDPPCDEEIRDIVRKLKRKRVEPIRE